MIDRRDGPMVRLYSRNAYDWTVRLSAIAAAAELVKAKSFTIDGEAVVLGPDGLSLFDELRRREGARAAMLYAFDLIEHDGVRITDPETCGTVGRLRDNFGRWRNVVRPVFAERRVNSPFRQVIVGARCLRFVNSKSRFAPAAEGPLAVFLKTSLRPALLNDERKVQNVSSCRRTGPMDGQRCSVRIGLKVTPCGSALPEELLADD
jgi:hypothetical protein